MEELLAFLSVQYGEKVVMAILAIIGIVAFIMPLLPVPKEDGNKVYALVYGILNKVAMNYGSCKNVSAPARLKIGGIWVLLFSIVVVGSMSACAYKDKSPWEQASLSVYNAQVAWEAATDAYFDACVNFPEYKEALQERAHTPLVLAGEALQSANAMVVAWGENGGTEENTPDVYPIIETALQELARSTSVLAEIMEEKHE